MNIHVAKSSISVMIYLKQNLRSGIVGVKWYAHLKTWATDCSTALQIGDVKMCSLTKSINIYCISLHL